MRTLKIFFTTLLIFLNALVYSQYLNNWSIGTNAGLSFSTAIPGFISGMALNNVDNKSAISDVTGNLLFYTDGTVVKNKLNATMPNGNGLVGNPSAGQCALIVPIPCSNKKYVIFHVTEYASPGNLSYSVIDMNLNGGLGDVVVGQKNISLGTGWTEKLCAYYYPTGNYYWLVSHKWSNNQFVALKIDATTIATSSVASNVGSIHSCGSFGGLHDAMGQLTISPDGSKIINAMTCSNKYEVFDFNLTTGVVSNSISISGNGSPWGTAFSPDSKKIYVDDLFGNYIQQYDITLYNSASIIASQYNISGNTSSGYTFGYMELGTNNQIYIAHPSTTNLSVVGNPNSLGAACNFSANGVSLGANASSFGVCRAAYNIQSSTLTTFTLNLSITQPTTCLGLASATVTPSTGSLSLTYSWSPGGFTTSSVSNLAPGIYTVNATDGNCNNAYTQFTVLPNPPLNATISASSPSACVGNSISLSLNVSGGTGALSYAWSNGANTPSISTTQLNGNYIYSVTINDAGGCNATKTVALTFVQNPTVGVTNATLCSGQTATLNASGASTYFWSNGANTPTITTSPTITSIYTVVGSLSSCTAQAQSTITVKSSPVISDSFQSNVLCNGYNNRWASVIVSLGTPAYTYSWSTLPVQTNSVANGLGIGIYTITITDFKNCIVSKTFTITQPSPLTLAVNSPTTCKNTSTVISVNVSGGTPVYNYSWQPNSSSTSTTAVITTSNTNYSVTVTDANGCITTATTSVIVSTVQANFNYLISPCDKSILTTNTSSNAVSYTWNLGDNTTSSTANPSHIYFNDGNYTISLIATNNLGCRDTLKKIVTLNSSDCDSTIFGVAKLANVSIVKNDVYKINFKIVAVNSSSNTLINVSLTENLNTAFPLPSTFTIVTKPQIESLGSALSINSLFDGITNTDLLNTTSNLFANKKDTITFTIHLSSNKNCGPFTNSIFGKTTTLLGFLATDISQNGLTADSDGDTNPKNNNDVTPIKLPFCELFVPDAFSPNSDGKNDKFVINGLNCRSITLNVFNRWGSKIYENTDYDNNWNGTASVKNTFSGNSLLPQGTYYYILQYNDGEKEVKTGFVVIQY